MNIYVVLSLGKRRMRTQISLDNASPDFNEGFWVVLDRDYDASQLLSMQVYHHSLHPAESDVRLGIAFYSLVGLRMNEEKDWKPVLGGKGDHEAGTVHLKITLQKVNKQQELAMEVRAFKLQDFTAWPASAGYVALATSLVRDPKWMNILKQLQPKLHQAVRQRQDSPHRVMMLLQGSPVLYAYGMVVSGGTQVTVGSHDAEDALAEGANLHPRIAMIQLDLNQDHTERIDLTKVQPGMRAETLFQAAFQRPLVVDRETTELVAQLGEQAMDVWLQSFANAINLALTNSKYDSLRHYKKREAKRLMDIARQARGAPPRPRARRAPRPHAPLLPPARPSPPPPLPCPPDTPPSSPHAQAAVAAREAEEATRIKASQVVESAVNIIADEAKDILNVVGLGRAGDALGSSINLFGRGLVRAGSIIADIVDDDDEESPKGVTPKKRGAPRACPRARPASSPAPPSTSRTRAGVLQACLGSRPPLR